VFRSKLVDFHVGPEGANFTVHAQPLARLSQPLNTLINGNMLEAKTGASVIDWKDTDEETFLRFCEFAYVQDYTPPRFGECSDNGDKPKQGDLETADLTGSGLVKLTKPTNPDNGYPAPLSNLLFRKQFEPVSNNSLHQDFTPVLFGHAQLYLLADKYDVPELEKLVLHKLNHTLKDSILYNEAHIANVMELVRFAYDNTPPSYQHEVTAISHSEANANTDGDKEKRVGSLRGLVAHYVVSKLDAVGESGAFLGLLRDGGDFVIDFWTMLRVRYGDARAAKQEAAYWS
jgi:hypothetical protein